MFQNVVIIKFYLGFFRLNTFTRSSWWSPLPASSGRCVWSRWRLWTSLQTPSGSRLPTPKAASSSPPASWDRRQRPAPFWVDRSASVSQLNVRYWIVTLNYAFYWLNLKSFTVVLRGMFSFTSPYRNYLKESTCVNFNLSHILFCFWLKVEHKRDSLAGCFVGVGFEISSMIESDII